MRRRIVATTETINGRTVVRLTQEKRPRRDLSTPRVYKLFRRRREGGFCITCGKQREKWRYRCNKCQKLERERRHNAPRVSKPWNWTSEKPITPHKIRTKEQDFLRTLEGWTRMGWDPVERITRRRSHGRSH